MEPIAKTLLINGMMCQHCEARVKKALEAIDGVTEATASHEKGVAVVTLSAPVDDAVLKAAVEAQDYEVTGIRSGDLQPITKTLLINGMMCQHCEARVKRALEAIDGVTEATASHEKGVAVVTLSAPVDDAVLKAAVEAQDYEVTGIQ